MKKIGVPFLLSLVIFSNLLTFTKAQEEEKMCRAVEIFLGSCPFEPSGCANKIADKYGPSVKVHNCLCDDNLYTHYACICEVVCPPPPPAPTF